MEQPSSSSTPTFELYDLTKILKSIPVIEEPITLPALHKEIKSLKQDIATLQFDLHILQQNISKTPGTETIYNHIIFILIFR